MNQPDISAVKSFLLTLQDTLCQYLAAADGKNGFNEDCWQHASGGGRLFFDYLNTPDFTTSFAFMRAVGNGFLDAYLPIVARRATLPWGERERQFQLYRRGRYVEFNLVWDRGTLFGLQSGGRTESILMSMPPLARWEYEYQPEPDSPEAALYRDFLPVKDWLANELA